MAAEDKWVVWPYPARLRGVPALDVLCRGKQSRVKWHCTKSDQRWLMMIFPHVTAGFFHLRCHSSFLLESRVRLSLFRASRAPDFLCAEAFAGDVWEVLRVSTRLSSSQVTDWVTQCIWARCPKGAKATVVISSLLSFLPFYILEFFPLHLSSHFIP